MKILAIIFFSLSGIVAILHFLAIAFKKETFQKVLKPFVPFFLALGSVFLVPSAPLIYVGGFLASLGDAFSIKRKDKTFLLFTVICFFLTHVAFFMSICAIIVDGGVTIPFWVYIIAVCSVVLVSFLLYPFSVHLIGKKSIPFTIYLAFLVLMVIASIQFIIATPNHWVGICCLVGYIFFVINGIFLGYSLVGKEYKYQKFFLMGSYYLALYLVVAGLLISCF